MSSNVPPPSNASPRSSQQFMPPPTHPSLRSASSSPGPAAHATRRVPPLSPRPTPQPRPSAQQTESSSVTASSSALEVPGNLHARAAKPEPATPGTLEVEPCEANETEEVVAVETEEEGELSEERLRELYDDEEIERFLRLFSSYVREAKVAQPSGKASQKGTANDLSETTFKSEDSQQIDIPCGDEDVDSDAWVEPNESIEQEETPPLPPRPVPNANLSLSERIVMDYLLPLLPLEPQPPTFTLRLLYLSIERLYLATVPAYEKLVKRLFRLATWEDKNTSLFYCAMYWFLWYQNLLLPALLLRILYSLVRRKVLPYPSLQELRKHRIDVERAKQFSSTVTSRLVAAPTYDVQDVWRIVHDFHRSRKLKKAARAKANNAEGGDHTDEGLKAEPEEPILSEESNAPETDIKRELLAIMNYVADLHERVKNIFLWRRPTSSLLYGVALFVVFVFSLLPAKYLCKLVGLAIGFAFWHVLPIILAIPPDRRTKYPPLFQDAPTDAEYAMELISQRVARGLDVKPKARRTRSSTPSQESDRFSLRTISGDPASLQPIDPLASSGSGTWQKWVDRVDTSMNVAKDAKKLFKDGQWKQPGNWLALNPLSANIAMRDSSEYRVQTYTFPAQYALASGLITLTPDALFFTPLLSSTAKVAIPSDAICGIKRTSPMKGLNVQWVRHLDDGTDEERVEKFLWVGDRDELFARLVAWGGHRWMNV